MCQMRRKRNGAYAHFEEVFRDTIMQGYEKQFEQKQAEKAEETEQDEALQSIQNH